MRLSRLPAILLPLLLLAMVGSGPALARDLYVSPRVGSGAANTDCSSVSPCTLGTAMRVAEPGDRVHLARGSYGRFGAPIPRRNGADGRAIEIRGQSSNPNAVVLRGFEIRSKSHVTWRDFRAGDLEIGREGGVSRNLRFQGLRIIGSLWAQNLSYSTFERCRVYPRQVRGGFESTRFRFGTSGSKDNVAFRNTMNACSVHVVANARDHHTITDWKIQFDSEDANAGRGVESCVFTGNVFRVVFQRSATSRARAVYWNRAQNCRFQDNRWLFEDSTTGGCPGGSPDQRMRIRNWVRGNVFLRDIFDLRGNCGALMLSSQSEGTERWQQGRNRWDGCFFRLRTANMSSYGPVRFDWGMNGDTVQNCVFLTRTGTCLEVPQLHAEDPSGSRPMTSVIRHNTFYATGSAPSAFSLETATGRWGSWDPSASLQVSRNIFHLAKPAGGSAAPAYFELWRGRKFVSDNNLFHHPSGGRSRAVRFKSDCSGGRGSGCTSARFSEVGGTDTPWYRAARADAGSRWGDPGYIQPSLASFDGRVKAGSAARFGPAGYVGARRPVASR
jgi:hypothetical protein